VIQEQDPAAIGEELMSTTAALRRIVRRRLVSRVPGPRLRGAQVELLLVVEHDPGIGVAVAANALNLAANSVSTLVNQLAGMGMLVRRTDPADRRAAQLELSGAAAERLDSWRHARAALINGGITALDPAQRRVLEGALPALQALVAALGGGAEP